MISGGLLWLLARSVGVQDTLEHLEQLDVGLAGLGASVLLLQLLLGATRWQLVGRCYGPAKDFGQLVRFSFMAQFFSQILPATLGGDAVRIWLYYKDGGTLRSSILGVVTDRVFGVVGLMLLVAAGLFTEQAGRLDALLRSGVALLVGGGFSAFAGLLLIRRLPGCWLSRFRVTRVARDLSEGIHGLISKYRDSLVVVGGSAAIHLASIASAWFIAAALGIHISPAVLFVTVPLAIFVSMVPITVSGWGLREGALVALLALYGVPSDGALALSLCFGLALALISLPGALLWATSRRRAEHISEEVERGYESL
jgi:uncharacterized protein (TIRG00374 family)